MKINCSLDNEKDNEALIGLLKNTLGSQINFIPLESIKKIKDNKIIILSKKIEKKECSLLINEILNHPNYLNIYLLPIKFFEVFSNTNIKLLYYPLNYDFFLREIFSTLNNQQKEYSDIILQENNLLKNRNNKKNIILTETESNILKYLFLNNSAKRELIRLEILNIQPGVESKSLESHFSRIRKKLAEIGSVVEIKLNNSVYVDIK